MIQTLEEGMKNQSKCIKIPMEIRPFDIGYRIVNKHGQALALKNGASIFALPSLAEKAIKKEFGKNDPDFDIEKHSVEEVAIVNLSKFHSYFEGGGRMSKFEIYLSKNDLEHIANGHDIKLKIDGKRFLITNEIILKPALMNDIMAPILNYKNKIIDTEQQNIVNSFIGGAR